MGTSLDKMYFLASLGDKEAENLLYQTFLSDGIKIANRIIYSNKFYRLKGDDFSDKIAECFLNVLATFSPKDSRFSTYSHFILDKKLTKAVMSEMDEMCSSTISLDDSTEEGRPVIETIPDPSIYPIPNEISVEMFKQIISSPKAAIGREEKRRQKVNELLCEGYSVSEISKKLNLTYGTVRGLIRRNDKDENLTKMKLELK